MTSLLLAGYLAVSKGRRIQSENPNTHKSTQHMYYDTVVQTAGVDVPAELRFWVPATEQPVVDGTVVDVMARVYAPPNEKMLLDVLQFVPFPGDPTSPKYEDSIPERPFPTMIVLGHTSTAAETMDDGISLGYQVQATEYLRDQNRTSRVYCRFDGNKARWKKAPRPSSGSAVFAVGLAYGVHMPSGHLMVDVDQLQLNVGTTAGSATTSVARAEAGGPPAKRRRFPTSAAGSSSSSSKSSRQENPFADAPAVPEAEVNGAEAPVEATANGTDAGATKKKSATGKRRAASRRDENDEAEE